jgi:hypothetical protein
MFAALPLLALPVFIYNVLVLGMPDRFHSAVAQDRMGQRVLDLPTASGGTWIIGQGDLLVFINHSLSMVLFVFCLVEFLLFRAFTTSAFFLITTMVVLDVLAGFIVTIVASRREIDVIN